MITPHAYISALFVLFLAGNPVLDYQPISSLLRQFRFVRFLLPTPYRVISYYTTNGLLPSPAESAAICSKSRRHPKAKHIQRQQQTHRPWWPCRRRQGVFGSWLLALRLLCERREEKPTRDVLVAGALMVQEADL